jgi:hypothetical protein
MPRFAPRAARASPECRRRLTNRAATLRKSRFHRKFRRMLASECPLRLTILRVSPRGKFFDRRRLFTLWTPQCSSIGRSGRHHPIRSCASLAANGCCG